MHATSEFIPRRILPKRIEAVHYNHARLALARLGRPLCVARPGHRGLEAILDDEQWLCVDAWRDDLPVLAWRAFEARGRGALDEPVGCRLERHHRHAGLVMGTALEALDVALRARLMSPPGRGE
ncbi:MAG TPA: hypothetical protein VEI74_04125 [Candidatus Methylomirabilis sp.]|nr:hypothetical protein [Candidatus Methylomirabilis sp.]